MNSAATLFQEFTNRNVKLRSKHVYLNKLKLTTMFFLRWCDENFSGKRDMIRSGSIFYGEEWKFGCDAKKAFLPPTFSNSTNRNTSTQNSKKEAAPSCVKCLLRSIEFIGTDF